MVKLPVLAGFGLSVLPVCDAIASTSGSRRMMAPSSCCSRIISCGETSWEAWDTPKISPVSWIGKNPLGAIDGEIDRERHGGEEHAEHDRLVAQHDVERAAIARQHRIETGFDDAVEPAMLLRLQPHEARAQHRRERQRNERRHRNRRGHREGEFAKHPADDPAHEQERNEHRDQRQADRQHREADFTRSDQRRLERRRAVFDVAIHVLDFDDGVVDHEADGDGQPHQRNVVEAEIEHEHRRERAEQAPAAR